MRIRRAFLQDQWPAAAGRDHVAEQGTLNETSNNRTIDAARIAGANACRAVRENERKEIESALQSRRLLCGLGPSM